MAVREVAHIGNPALRQAARALEPDEIRSPRIAALVDDMIDTMRALGGIGIAAPQVSEPVQVAIIEIAEGSTRYRAMTPAALTVLVNPRITVLDETEQGFWEGCLSVPDLRGLVHRPRKVRVDYLDLENRAHSIVAEDFLATVLQHELDHLHGILFIDKVRDTTKLATLADYERFWVDAVSDNGDV
jgi:peptide deformylase